MVRIVVFINICIFILLGCSSVFDVEKSFNSTSNFNLKLNNKSYNQVVVKWDSIDLAESYTLAYWQNTTPPKDCTQGTVINNISKSTTTYSIESLSENQFYSFRVCVNLKSKSFSSETGSVSVKTSRQLTI